MKRNVAWVLPGLLAATAIVWSSACTSSDDPIAGDPDAAADAGGGGKDSTAPTEDANSGDGSTVKDSGGDSSSDDGGDAGPIDPYVAACARIDACATATTPRIGMNGCYSLLTAAPFETSLHAPERAQLENLRCKLAATTCTAVRACDRPLTDFAALCQEKEGGDHCAGNVHVACGDNPDTMFAPVAAVDCAATGEVCGGDSGFQSGCGIAPCTFGEVAPTCNGTTLTECQSTGVTKKIDCKTSNQLLFVKPFGAVTIAGTTCGPWQLPDNEVGDNTCTGEGASCSGFAGQRCDGTVLETCAGGKLARRDCATVFPAGQGCVVLEDGPDRIHGARGCGPVNPTCHTTDNETCNVATGVIGFCGLVGPKTVDCKALGYAGCKTTTVDGRVTAACFQ
jgi:hypothetical protein